MSNVIDNIILKMFKERWSGDLVNASIEKMRVQLYKTLSDQVAGYWSGHTAYHIAVDGGFLKDSERKPLKDSSMRKGKELTELGKIFMLEMEGGR